jgi:endonuclease YncB( thermonuclease family)
MTFSNNLKAFKAKVSTYYMIYSMFRNWWNKRLLMKASDDISLFCLDGFKGWAKIVNVYDGDTFRACVYHRNTIMKFNFRPLGYDAPEIKPRLNIPNRNEHIKKAKEAREFFIKLLGFSSDNEVANVGQCGCCCFEKDGNDGFIFIHCQKNDKYGRTLVTMYKQPQDDVSINDMMINSGLVLPYDGKTKKDFNFELSTY